jgi:hypothetical protein
MISAELFGASIPSARRSLAASISFLEVYLVIP